VRVEKVYGFTVAARNQVPINIDCDLNAGVSELLLHVDRAYSLAEQMACKSMSGPRGPFVPGALTFSEWPEDTPDEPLLHGPAVFLKDEIRSGLGTGNPGNLLCLQEALQRLA